MSNFKRVLVLLTLVGGCSPQYESGVTRCSEVDDSCPTGMTCRDGICFSGRSATGGIGGEGGSGGIGGIGGIGGGGGTPNTGGTPGTGGMPNTGGTPGTGGTSGECTDPMAPKVCPARGGANASCVGPEANCNSLIKCPGADKVTVCKEGFNSDCRYPVNVCGPTGASVCQADAKFTQYCPAIGMVGPRCIVPTYDCSSYTVCSGKLTGCPTGQVVDAATCKCVQAPVGPCPDVTKPQQCTPPAGVTQMCYAADAVCSTIAVCGTNAAYCTSPGDVIDCGAHTCVAAAKCPTADPTDKCQVCLASKCCTATAACLNDAACTACLKDPACTATTGAPGVGTWLSCVSTFCSADCKKDPG